MSVPSVIFNRWSDICDKPAAIRLRYTLKRICFKDDIELHVVGCRVDILGTNCDQCLSMAQCCFTSTETARLIRTESQNGHLDFHTAPELWLLQISRPVIYRQAALC